MRVDENKLRGLLGLSVRARQSVFGMDGCLKAIRAQEAGVVILSVGASKATKEKYEDACRYHGIPLIVVEDDLLEEATGRPGVAMVVNKGGLADKIISLPAMDGREEAIEQKQCGGANVE